MSIITVNLQTGETSQRELTQAEIAAIPPAVQPTASEQIAALESANPITHRNLRDIMVLLGTLTEQVTGLPADANPAVKKAKAIEAQIAALRSQM
jgi:hypothetical protein